MKFVYHLEKESVVSKCDRRSCRVRSLMQVLLLQRSIFGERTMHIDCSRGFKCDVEGTA